MARQRAILNKASAIYNRTKSEQATNQYLATQGVNNYVIDYNLSSPDALVAINTNINQATLAFRGSQNMMKNGSDWFENAEVFEPVEVRLSARASEPLLAVEPLPSRWDM